jgi:2-polyprenyl-3-methyl-5-hydroxy-6-metoxy-1,4-benzoquinol methylase
MTTTANSTIGYPDTSPSGEPDPAGAPFDASLAEQFADRLVGMLNDAALALMTSIGHQVGLFDVLAELPPGTSQEIATAAGLQERYVREWLAAMTTGRVINYDPRTQTYRLPAEHSAFLTRAAGPDNLAHLMQLIPLLASVEEPVVASFRNGGGVPYSAFPRFHQLMAEDSAMIHDGALIDGILPLVPGLIDRLHAGIDVADIGCGQGHAINLMAAAFPKSRFTGYDFSVEAIEAARREATQLGLTNSTFEIQDVTDLGITDAYELITAFDAIHDQAQPARVPAGIAAALRPAGLFLMVDVKASSDLQENLDLLWGPFLYTVSTMHCMTVSLALDGTGLGTAWGERIALAMLKEAGFSGVQIKNLEPDTFNNYYIATRKG